MPYYNISFQIGKNVQFAGTERQSFGPEYVYAVIVHASDDSSWLTFDQAKAGAISCLKRVIVDLTATQPADSPELKVSKMKLERLENLKEKDMLSHYREGQGGVSL
jgi:hypothetical protein